MDIDLDLEACHNFHTEESDMKTKVIKQWMQD